MRSLSPSRTGSKQRKALRPFKQLESIFRKTDTLTRRLQPRPLPQGEGWGEGDSKILRRTRDIDLEATARELLRSLGAEELARKIRVEWNPRLKTCAGRADYREKLISLNPLLHELGNALRQDQFSDPTVDCLRQSPFESADDVVSGKNQRHAVIHGDEINRTLRHELAHLVAQWRVGRRRIAPHGSEWRRACRDLGIADEARCHNLPFATKSFPRRYVYRCPNCKEKFPRVRRIRRAIACLACCRKHNGGAFDARFRLKRLT